ncbi:MAG: hypothetical protein MZU84_04605 [Sphingobacterium sp.]|nr:hypothetical protein [Sphingobacterium sp.]
MPGPALAFLEAHEGARLYITFTVAGELAAGARSPIARGGRRSSSPFYILPFTDDVAWEHGRAHRHHSRATGCSSAPTISGSPPRLSPVGCHSSRATSSTTAACRTCGVVAYPLKFDQVRPSTLGAIAFRPGHLASRPCPLSLLPRYAPPRPCPRSGATPVRICETLSSARPSAAAAVGLFLGAVTGGSAPPAVPITFDQFHTTTAVFKYLKDVAAAYPGHHRAVARSARSTMGRPDLRAGRLEHEDRARRIDALVPLRNPRAEGVEERHADEALHGQAGPLDRRQHARQRVHRAPRSALYMIDKLVSRLRRPTRRSRRSSTPRRSTSAPSSTPTAHFNSLEKGISQRANSACSGTTTGTGR